MAKRASLRGKGAEIFYPVDEGTAEPAATVAEQPRARKPKPLPVVTPETPLPPADIPASSGEVVVKTPATVLAAPAPTPSATPALERTPPPASVTIPPLSPPAPAGAVPSPAGGMTIAARYERLAGEIDTLYEIAARKIAAGRGIGQTMQWLSEARRLVVAGKTADFAQAEWLVHQVSGLLKHGDEIDHLYAEILEQVGDNPDLVRQARETLHQARIKLMTGQTADLIEAEYLMEEVKGTLARVHKSRVASNSWGTRFLWGWLVTWLLILLGLFILDRPLAELLYYRCGWIPAGSVPPTSLALFMLPWLCLVWGAVGSVFDTLIAINEHMAKLTYDGHYIAQGLASPIYGAILGLLIYFLFTGGIVAIGTGVAFSSLGGTTATADVQAMANTASRSLALWVVAFLAGFFHNRTFDLLSKVFDQILITLKILPEPEKKEEAAPAVVSKPSVTVTSPPAGSQAQVGETVSVQVTAVDASGVSRVELWADGVLIEAQKLPFPQPTVTATLKWTATTAGGHALMVKAYNVAETASEPVILSLLVSEQEPGPPAPPEVPPAPPEGPPPGEVIT